MVAYIQDIRNELPEDSIVFYNPSFDNSIIGVTTDDRVVYSFEKMVEELMNDDDISEIEAIEFIEYNTIRSLPYVECGPIIVYELRK